VVRYRFGDFELDPRAYTLKQAGAPVVLQPKVFDVVRHLIEHRDRLVTKDELLDTLWPGEHVNESAVVWSISHARRALGQDRAQKQPIETVHGRGYRFTAPIEALTGTPPPKTIDSATPRDTAPSRKPFVGRVDVMRRLDRLLDEAKQARGSLAVLAGESGIGKTRCAEELLASARARGVSTWIGRAAEGVSAPVFWPIIQILRDAARERAELRAACEPILSHLTALDAASAASRDPMSAHDGSNRFWLLDAIWRSLREAAEQKPIAILIDDWQWADAGTTSLVRFLSPELPSSRVLIVATLREEGAAPDDAALRWLARHAERIQLARLTPEDIGRYLAEVSGARDLPGSLSKSVHRATAGNPLFVQETVRMLLADHREAALHALAEIDIKPAQAVRDVLHAQLGTLAPETRALLAQASVLGESFELSVLAKIAGSDPDRLLGLLEPATKAGFTQAETPERYRFSHALLRSILYEETPVEERVGVHRRAAEVLEEFDPAEPRHGEIAYHFYRSLPAGAYDRVSAAARRAAAAAESVSAYEDAVRFYRWALEAQALHPGVKPRARAELLLACANAQRSSGRDRDASATVYRMFELARAHGYADLLLLGSRILRPTHSMSSVPDDKVRAALEEVARIVPEGANEQRVSALSLLACVPPYSLDMKRSKELSAEALALAREIGTDRTLLEALCARLFSLSGPDDIDALLATTDEMLALERARTTWMTLEAYSARYAALIYRGDAAGADRALEAYGRAARQTRHAEVLWYYDRMVAQRRMLDGDFAGAEAAFEALRARSDRMGLSYGAWMMQMQLQRLSIERHGLKSVAKDWNYAAIDQAPILLRTQMIRAAAEFGPRDLARAALHGLAASDFADIPKDLAYLEAIVALSFAAVALADRALGERLYAMLAPYPHHNTPNGLLWYQGSVSQVLGLLAALLGDDAGAERHFEDALAMNERTGQRPQVARTRFAYAQFLASRGETERARALNGAARDLAATLGMEWLEAEADALSAAAQ
jgi:DNA-binding winged helix-turn-helix (wHTH) protein